MPGLRQVARDYLAALRRGLISFVVFSMREGKLKGREALSTPLYSDEPERCRVLQRITARNAAPPLGFSMKKQESKRM
jgi:hypothetical protein